METLPELLAETSVAYQVRQPEMAIIGLGRMGGGMIGVVADAGSRRTVEKAIRQGAPAQVVSAAQFARFASRRKDSPTSRVVVALRNQFGGHAHRSS